MNSNLTTANAGTHQHLQTLLINHVNALGPFLKICGQLNPVVNSTHRSELAELPLLLAPTGQSHLVDSEFLLFKVFCRWTPSHLAEVMLLLGRQLVTFSIEMEVEGFKFIKIKYEDWDFGEFIIGQRHIGSPIDEEDQRESFLKIVKKLPQDPISLLNIPNHKNNFPFRQRSPNVSWTWSPNKTKHDSPFPIRGKENVGVHEHNKRMPNSVQLSRHVDSLRKQTSLRLQRPTVALPSSLKFPDFPVYDNSAIGQFEKILPKTGYTINKLTIGNTYDVSVCSVEKGPHLFSVQLANTQSQVLSMMTKIENVEKFDNLTGKLTVGMPCIARYCEDKQLYRAVVTNVLSCDSQVNFVDYGNSQTVKNSDLYVIPKHFLQQPAYALPFSLAGLKAFGVIDENLKETFKEMVLYKTCKIKVTSPEEPEESAYQNCELYLEHKNILDLLKLVQQSQSAYPKAPNLKNFQLVVIRYIDSPCSFFVQAVSNISQFDKLADDMLKHYNKNPAVPQNVQIGAPYAVEADGEWFRCTAVQVDDQAIVVRLTDYGNNLTVTKESLRDLSPNHLRIPTQVVHCCLTGVENHAVKNKDLMTTQLEMLAEDPNGSRHQFAVRVYRIESNDLHIVNLFDKQLNLSKLLLKHSMPLDEYKTQENEELEFKRRTNDENINICSSIEGDNQSNLQSKNSFNENTNALMQFQKHKSQEYSHNDQLNTSVESTDHLDDASSEGYRHHAKDTAITQKSSYLGDSERERSENGTPKGYFPSLRESVDSQYGVEIGYDKSASPITSVMSTKSEEYMPLDSHFPQENIFVPGTEEASICYWVSPHKFFIQRKARYSEFADLMRNIQRFYTKKPLQNVELKPDLCVVARNCNFNMLCRARILSCNHALRKYKVYFVDFGNQCTVTREDIWPIDRRFADFPTMASYCSLCNIVSNYDHAYILNRMDKFLPKTATIVCDFKERVNNLFYVNVKVNNIPLIDSLVADGLVSQVSPDTSIELLAGQQIRAKISSIQNMLDFKISFEGCDVPLLCSYDDIRYAKSNPDIDNKFKKFYEGKSCMLDISAVNENKVILLRPVLPLFRDEISTYICNMACIKNSFEGRKAFVSSAHRLFFHPLSVEYKIGEFVEDMYEYYEKQGSHLSSFKNGTLCAAKSYVHCEWYRALILQPIDNPIEESSRYEIYFIDYGNTEIIEKEELKILEERFYSENAYAVEINLPIRLAATKSSQEEKFDVIKQLDVLLNEKPVTIQPIECCRNHLIAEIIIEGGRNLLDILIEMKLVDARDVEGMRKQLENDKSRIWELNENVDFTPNDGHDTNLGNREADTSQEPVELADSGVNCYVSHINSINDFYIQYERDSHVLELIETGLRDSKQFRKITKFTKDKIVAALFSDDECWYRAKLLKPLPDNEGFEVQFIDFGNIAVTADCREISADLANLPALSKRCSLNFPNKGGLDMWGAAEKKFVDIAAAGNTIFSVEIHARYANKDIVSLYIDNININIDLEPFCTPEYADEPISFDSSYSLGAQSVANFPTSNCSQIYSVVISHKISPECFFVQFEKDSARLEDIMKALNTDRSTDMERVKENIEIGQLYAAIYDDDKKLYRARVLEVDESNGEVTYSVFFVDYGNEVVVSELRMLPHNLKQIPELCICCTLNGVTSLYAHADVDTVSEMFDAIIDIYDGVVKLDFEQPHPEKGAALVNLYMLSTYESIYEQILATILNESAKDKGIGLPKLTLEPPLHDCEVVQINSTASFYVQLVSDMPEIDKITEKLYHAETKLPIFFNIRVDALCAAQFPDDGYFYRARIVKIVEEGNKERNVYPKCLVHFIDFGNDSITDQFRKLPDEILMLPPYSKHCALNTKLKNEIFATKCFNEFTNKNYEEPYKIKFRNQSYKDELSGRPVLCDLFYQTKNVANEIEFSLRNA